MIDTNKYEGHTPAPWRVVKPSQANATGHIWCIESATEIDYSPDHYTRVAHICVIHNEDDDTINAELIADAPLLFAEVKRLRIIETAAQLYGDYCQERHGQSYDCDMSFEEWLDWMLTDDILEKMMIHYDKEALDDMKSKATGTGWLLDGCLTDYSKLKGLVE